MDNLYMALNQSKRALKTLYCGSHFGDTYNCAKITVYKKASQSPN